MEIVLNKQGKELMKDFLDDPLLEQIHLMSLVSGNFYINQYWNDNNSHSKKVIDLFEIDKKLYKYIDVIISNDDEYMINLLIKNDVTIDNIKDFLDNISFDEWSEEYDSEKMVRILLGLIDYNLTKAGNYNFNDVINNIMEVDCNIKSGVADLFTLKQ